MAFSSTEDVVLAELVGQHPCLHDLKHPQYKDQNVRENVLAEIGKQLGRPSDMCKKRWKNMKDTYNRRKKESKIGTGSAANAKRTKWPLAEALSFLDAVRYEGQTITNISQNVESFQDISQTVESFQDISQDIESVSNVSQNAERNQDYLNCSSRTASHEENDTTDENGHETYPVPKKRFLETQPRSPISIEASQDHLQVTETIENISEANKSTPSTSGFGVKKRKHSVEQTNQQVLDILKKRSNEREEILKALNRSKITEREDDATDVFFRSMSLTVKQLPPSLRAQAKMRICSFVSELEIRALEMAQHTNMPPLGTPGRSSSTLSDTSCPSHSASDYYDDVTNSGETHQSQSLLQGSFQYNNPIVSETNETYMLNMS